MRTTKIAKYMKRLVIVRSAEHVKTIAHDRQSFRLFLLRNQQKSSVRFLERPDKRLSDLVIIVFVYLVYFVVNRVAFRGL